MTKVYIDELEEKGLELVNYSKINIANKIQELKEATKSFNWQGPGYQSYVLQYNSKIKKLEKINDNLNKIAFYLIEAKDDYDDVNHRINSMYEELLNEYKELKNEL